MTSDDPLNKAGDPAKSPEPEVPEAKKEDGGKTKTDDPVAQVIATVGVVAVLIMIAIGVATGSDSGTSEAGPEPSPTYSGTTSKWRAYEAGHNFGQANNGTARIPANKAHKANTLGEELYEAANGQANDSQKDLMDAMAADRADAVWWCEENIPNYLKTAHAANRDALVDGCIGGVLPIFDAPYMYGERVTPTGKAAP
ncbi:hypothetical protein ACFXB3_12760 [Streptomyces sp. NPDC059447]|uniref:hypothetical protein n=1 Tax=Streptomyces sp. NPDC059447 TaxID=3346834 RepID=UPI0036C9283F